MGRESVIHGGQNRLQGARSPWKEAMMHRPGRTAGEKKGAKMRADGLGHWGDKEQGPQQLSPWSRLIGQRKRGRKEGTLKAGGRGIEDNGARSLTPKQSL